MSNGNTEILRQAYKRWHDSKGGTVDHWISIMAEDVDFRSLADGSTGLEFTENRISKHEVKNYFEGLLATFKMIHYTVDQFVTEGDTVVAIGSTSWQNIQTGKSFNSPKVDVIKFQDGKITAFFEYYDTATIQECTC